jgi:hypothetical protein
MRYRDSGPWPLIVMAFAILFIVSWCQIPAQSSTPILTDEALRIMEEDLPLMELGKEEAVKMRKHLIDTGEYTQDKGYYYYIRTYDAGRAQPPGMEEYYNLTVHLIYVPAIASGFNIGLEYELETGDQNKYGDHQFRRVIQYHLDDPDEDLMPNTMIKAVHEFSYGIPAKTKYTKVDAFQEWRYWVYYWYSTFLEEGMK